MYCPHKGNRPKLLCEAVQGYQAHPGKAFVKKTPIVASANALELHTAEAHSDPGIKIEELVLDSAKGRSEVMGKPSDNPVEVSNDVLVEVMGADGKGANSVFENHSFRSVKLLAVISGHIIFALPPLKTNQRDVVLLRKGLHSAGEGLSDATQQHRRGNLVNPMIDEKIDQLSSCLQGGNVTVQIAAVETLDSQGDVLAK